MEITIKGKTYLACEEASKNRWSRKKGNYKYAKGLLNSAQDPYKTERIGLLGEMAFGLLINLKPDLEYREGGDDYDFIYNDQTIDVKTAAKKPPLYYNLLIKACEGNNLIKAKLKSDIYVQAYLQEEYRDKGWATIGFIGFVRAENIDTKTLHQSRQQNSSHKNYEFPFNQMEPMENLIK